VSVLDQLRDFERQVVSRLRELEPLVREYEQLRVAAERLGVSYQPRADAGDGDRPRPRARRRATRASTGAPRAAATGADRGRRAAKPTARSAKAGGTSRAGARRRSVAAPGQRQQQMLVLVREHPGITVAEIAQRLGIDATGLYRVVHRLTKAGEVQKDGRRLYPASSTGSEADRDGGGDTRGSTSRAGSRSSTGAATSA
jgi:transposase-like protein